MVDALALAMKFTLASEGEYTVDDGGPTMCGVTQSTYDSWRSAHGLPLQSVQSISQEEVAAIMYQRYWLPAHCDALPAKLAIANFDTAYNEGPPEAIEILQHCLGVDTDGQWGPITARALQTALPGDKGVLLESYLSRRLAVYRLIEDAHPADEEYLGGWDNRVADLRKFLAGIAT